MTVFGFATLGVLALYLALFFLASSWAARAAGRPVWLFGHATGRDRLAARGFRIAFALAFVGPILQTAVPALSEADPLWLEPGAPLWSLPGHFLAVPRRDAGLGRSGRHGRVLARGRGRGRLG